MEERATLELVKIIGNTVKHLEQNSNVHDPAIEKLKHSLVLVMAELELMHSDKKAA